MDERLPRQAAIAKAARPPHPVSLPLLRGEFPRPGQCRLRRARHERGSRLHAVDLRRRRRHLLRRLYPVRDPEQSRVAALRRAHLDRAHHDQLGARRRPPWPWSATRRASSIMRFPLGVAEAGFFPGIILYLTYWFPARERARIVSLFMAAVPLATVVGGPVSGALLELHGLAGLKGWQLAVRHRGRAGGVARHRSRSSSSTTGPNRRAGSPSARSAGARASARRGGRGDARDGLPGSARRSPGPRVLDARPPLFLHRGRALRHRLLDAAGDPDFRLPPLEIGFLTAIPYLFAAIAMVLCGRAFRRDRRAHLACRAAAHPRLGAAFAWSGLPRPLPPHHDRAHLGRARHLCRDRHLLVAADLDPDRDGRRGGARADQLHRQSRRVAGPAIVGR